MNIAIVGLGVIGGSFAKGLQAAGYTNVYGIDVNESTLKTAVNQGIIKKGFVEANDILQDMDVVMISLYPNQIASFVGIDNMNHFIYLFKKEVGMTPSAYRKNGMMH